jgi:hypothetical protein
VTSQEPKGPDSRGVVSCNSFFTVIDESEGTRSEITAAVNLEIWTKNAGSQYDLMSSASADEVDVANLGDRAFWAEENAWLVVLDGPLLVKIDVGMPGIIKETNRPVADAIAPIVLGKL